MENMFATWCEIYTRNYLQKQVLVALVPLRVLNWKFAAAHFYTALSPEDGDNFFSERLVSAYESTIISFVRQLLEAI
jgi:hypothetical protein